MKNKRVSSFLYANEFYTSSCLSNLPPQFRSIIQTELVGTEDDRLNRVEIQQFQYF